MYSWSVTSVWIVSKELTKLGFYIARNLFLEGLRVNAQPSLGIKKCHVSILKDETF